MSQFKRMQAHIRIHGEVKWKHVMHLIRLLISGTKVLREGSVPVRVEEHRERLLAIKRAEMPWHEVDQWRHSLHEQFNEAFQHTSLPERPDYEKANRISSECDDGQRRLVIMSQVEEFVTLFRPVGQKELDLVRESGWQKFPPRLSWQPIFYPVLSEQYAVQIARDWNTNDPNSGLRWLCPSFPGASGVHRSVRVAYGRKS